MPSSFYHRAVFLQGAHNLSQLPLDQGSEVAFAGRSNAGKSSAINVLTGQRGLARVSKTPGRTQQLIFFKLDEQRRLVDLPGYGYAKAPRALKHHWQHTLQEYLIRRQSLRGLVLLMDVRHPLMDSDKSMVTWCETANLPLHLVLTKADKLSYGKASGVLQQVRALLKKQNSPVTVQLFSVLKFSGIEELQAQLDLWFMQG